jgi:hypothetical protein
LRTVLSIDYQATPSRRGSAPVSQVESGAELAEVVRRRTGVVLGTPQHPLMIIM